VFLPKLGVFLIAYEHGTVVADVGASQSVSRRRGTDGNDARA
jgi:hypothetical protein